MDVSSATERAQALVSAGRPLEALSLLDRAASADDADALFTLGVWHLAGDVVRRDLAASREYMRRSAAAGRRDAGHVYAAFVANGTGGSSDWAQALKLLDELGDASARRQLQIIARMRLSDNGDPLAVPEAEPLSDSPEAKAYRGLFTKEECSYLIELAEQHFRPSIVLDPRDGRSIANPVRTSDGMAFPLMMENPAVHALNRRIAAASGTDVRQGEPLQILRYAPGQEYKAHVDALPVGANQRVLTMLVYLNEGYEGGETQFLETDLGFRGQTGDALLFRNASNDGKPDPRSRHAGMPVTTGTKFLASRWIRARPLDLMSPTG